MRFEKPENWLALVSNANTVEAYKAIVHAMLNDNIVNDGRLLVLEVYTRDVCEKYPDIAEGVWSHFRWMWRRLNSCWYRPFPKTRDRVLMGAGLLLLECLSGVYK